MKAWNKPNNICRYTILGILFDKVYDVYCLYKSTCKILDILNKKYILEDVGYQKYLIGNFLYLHIVKEKVVMFHIHDFHMLVNDVKLKRIDRLKSLLLVACWKTTKFLEWIIKIVWNAKENTWVLNMSFCIFRLRRKKDKWTKLRKLKK